MVDRFQVVRLSTYLSIQGSLAVHGGLGTDQSSIYSISYRLVRSGSHLGEFVPISLVWGIQAEIYVFIYLLTVIYRSIHCQTLKFAIHVHAYPVILLIPTMITAIMTATTTPPMTQTVKELMELSDVLIKNGYCQIKNIGYN